MTYTTNQLIADAYYASGIVGRGFEQVNDYQYGNGLIWLNELIGKKVVEPDLIPYEGTYVFNAVIGQETYSVPNLMKADTMTFVYSTVRYPMRKVERDEYWGSGRVNTIESLPYMWFGEPTFAGMDISMYWLPNQTFQFTIKGIFRLANIVQGQDLSLTLNTFYTTYLKWELSAKICQEYAMPVPSGTAQQLAEYQAIIDKQSRPMDLTIYKSSTLQKQQRLGWAWVNLGKGYLPTQ